MPEHIELGLSCSLHSRENPSSECNQKVLNCDKDGAADTQLKRLIIIKENAHVCTEKESGLKDLTFKTAFIM